MACWGSGACWSSCFPVSIAFGVSPWRFVCVCLALRTFARMSAVDEPVLVCG